MGIITDVRTLDPRMRPGVEKYLCRCRERGIPVALLEARRELSVHMAYYARGRCDASIVRAFFVRCGLWDITDAEAATASTQTLYSKHVEGLAVDVAPTKDGKVWWAAPRELWLRMFSIAEDECGLDACAAGKWQAWQWDWPHHEFHHEI